MGGLGAGCICLNGEGGLQNFSIRHVPATTPLPDNHDHSQPSVFAAIHIKGAKPITRLVEGPLPPEKIYDQGLQAQGYRHGGHEGLPRFRRASFLAEFPFGTVELSDPKVPLTAAVTGFNPFIPLDDKNSGLPCAILEYTFRNVSRKTVDYEFSFHCSHLAVGAKEGAKGTQTKVIPRRGVFYSNTEAPRSESLGSACLLALKDTARVKGMWFRGGWFDAISALWREVSTGRFTSNQGWNGVDLEGRNGGSILIRGRLKPGQSATHPVVVAWHFPNNNFFYTEGSRQGKVPEDKGPAWRPYYAGQWKNAQAVAEYVRRHYASLRSRTWAFRRALEKSTVPEEVFEAVSFNLAILKSPTVLRLENGQLWGWEGCFTNYGCCAGSCTHVWNYAQAFPHLFPPLERSLREQEWGCSMDECGHVGFRAAIPPGPVGHGWHAAADGQLGGLLKFYRDWQISGDKAWLKKLYPLAKRSLDYCIGHWDPDRRGAVFEPHHNTYDIEFWGPDGMCTSIYIGALSAMSEMAGVLKQTKDEKEYEALAKRGAAFMDKELFNGEYYHQKVQYRELRDQSFVQKIEAVDGTASESLRLLREEGPKYQYGTGCLSDGVIGAWMADLYGVKTPMNRAHLRRTLQAIFRHNFRRNLREHANSQRPGYAYGNEPGLLLCSWPKGGKPTLPFVYSDEVWTGIEYQIASHLFLEGLVQEGLQIVKAVRSRHDGRVRDPFNEYECGSYYARAMASYALLPSLAGFRYSAVEKKLWFGPKIARRPFTAFFCTAAGFGTITLEQSALSVTVVEGSLAVERLQLDLPGSAVEWIAPARVRAGQTKRFLIPKNKNKSKTKIT